MKKNLLYYSIIAVAVAFTACSTDGNDAKITKEPASSSVAPTLSASLSEALTLKFNPETAPFKEISFTETNRAIITKKQQPIPSIKRRAEGKIKDEYIVGTYTLTVEGSKNIYNIKDENGKDYCTVEVANIVTGKSLTAKIRLMSGKEIEEFEAAFTGKNRSVICREIRGLTGKGRLRSCRGCVTIPVSSAVWRWAS